MIVINPSTRQFNIPGADMTFGVEADSGSERKYFQCPRYVGNHLDLTGCFVRMNYRNANGEIDSYLVEDLTVDGDNVLFSWELYPKVTAYKGQVRFVMCVVGPDTKVAWHTTLGTGVVLEGLEPDYAMIQAGTADVVAQLIAMTEAQTAAVENKGAEWVRNVQSEGTDQIVAVQTAGAEAKAAAVAEIEAKGVNVRESIPDDYTAVSEAVDGMVRGRAGAIVCEVAGSAVAVNDASDNYIQGLRIFGRSTQDGTPTPDAPVEIESVEEPIISVTRKNLLNHNYVTGYQTHNGITYTDAGDGRVGVNGTATANTSFAFASFTAGKRTFIPAGTYTVSGNPSEDVYFGFFLYDSQEISDYSQGMSRIKGGVPWTFTIEKDSYYGAYINVTEGRTASAVISPQLELGSVATEYEPPAVTQTINIGRTLPGYPVTSGGNHIDGDGQQWICDEVDFEKGVYVQRLGVIIDDGSGFISIGTHTNGQPYRRYSASNINPSYIPMSDRYKGYTWSNQNGMVYIVDAQLIATDSRFVDTETTAAILANEKPTFIYVLATPIETALSETELATYRALHSNYPNTTVLNDAGAHMVVKYAADTKLYIDNKIAALIGG